MTGACFHVALYGDPEERLDGPTAGIDAAYWIVAIDRKIHGFDVDGHFVLVVAARRGLGDCVAISGGGPRGRSTEPGVEVGRRETIEVDGRGG